MIVLRDWDFAAMASRGLVLLAAKAGRDGSLDVHQAVDLWVAFIGAEERRELRLRSHGQSLEVTLWCSPIRRNGGMAEAAEGPPRTMVASIQ
jgi:hypothetical protein